MAVLKKRTVLRAKCYSKRYLLEKVKSVVKSIMLSANHVAVNVDTLLFRVLGKPSDLNDCVTRFYNVIRLTSATVLIVASHASLRVIITPLETSYRLTDAQRAGGCRGNQRRVQLTR